jgi:hypothetical protein
MVPDRSAAVNPAEKEKALAEYRRVFACCDSG